MNTYMTVWGWQESALRGQVRYDSQLNLKSKGCELNDDLYDTPCFTIKFGNQNRWACIPGANFVMAFVHFQHAWQENSSNGVILAEDRTRFRVLCVIAGVAELTWIGGMLLHLITMVYFDYIAKHLHRQFP